MRTFIQHIAIVLFALTLPSSCGIVGSKEAPGNNHVVLMDISGSALMDLDANISDVETKLLRKLGPKDRLTVLAIDDASLTWAEPLFQLDLTDTSFVQKALPVTVRGTVAEQSRAAYLDTLASAFAQQVRDAVRQRKESDGLTDIFGALEIANGQYRAGMLNYLWIQSDMKHEGRELNLVQALKQRQDLQQLVPQAPAVQLGFEHVCAFTGNNSKDGGPKFEAIKGFWLAYFREHRIPIRVYTSGRLVEQLTAQQLAGVL